MAVSVTTHAVDRYIERVDASLTHDQARDRILSASRAIEAAAQFGCRVVRLATGAKLIIDNNRVVTVIPRGRPWGGHPFYSLNGEI